MRKSYILIIVVVVLICSCSTPYQPIGALGGYDSSKFEDNTYRVMFKGNQHTKAEAVFENLIRRCSEITIKGGYEYFVIYEDSSYMDKTVIVDEPDLIDQLAFIQNRKDRYLLDRKPAIDPDPWQTLEDQKSRIARTYTNDYGTYSNAFVDTKATDVVGVYKIQLFEEQIEGFEDYFFSAIEILKKYDME
jgi:hypothetical protein